MATVIIKRTSEYNNWLRDYQLFLDGKKIGTVANGQTKEFETTSGQHTILAKIDWCSSPEISFTLQEVGRKELKVGGFKNGNWIMPTAMGIIVLHLILQLVFHFEYLIFLIIPAFISLVYYLTAGRKKYLTMIEF